jgi:hypothetical protein
MGLLYSSTSSNKAVLHTVSVEGDNITASYVSINCMMMGCMESNWMIETKQQMEKNSFAYIFGYKYSALKIFLGFKKEISYVVNVEFISSTG